MGYKYFEAQQDAFGRNAFTLSLVETTVGLFSLVASYLYGGGVLGTIASFEIDIVSGACSESINQILRQSCSSGEEAMNYLKRYHDYFEFQDGAENTEILWIPLYFEGIDAPEHDKDGRQFADYRVTKELFDDIDDHPFYYGPHTLGPLPRDAVSRGTVYFTDDKGEKWANAALSRLPNSEDIEPIGQSGEGMQTDPLEPYEFKWFSYTAPSDGYYTCYTPNTNLVTIQAFKLPCGEPTDSPFDPPFGECIQEENAIARESPKPVSHFTPRPGRKFISGFSGKTGTLTTMDVGS